jgi:hypothetical protein
MELNAINKVIHITHLIRFHSTLLSHAELGDKIFHSVILEIRSRVSDVINHTKLCRREIRIAKSWVLFYTIPLD